MEKPTESGLGLPLAPDPNVESVTLGSLTQITMADLPPSQLSPAIVSPGQIRHIDENAPPPLLELQTVSPSIQTSRQTVQASQGPSSNAWNRQAVRSNPNSGQQMTNVSNQHVAMTTENRQGNKPINIAQQPNIPIPTIYSQSAVLNIPMQAVTMPSRGRNQQGIIATQTIPGHGNANIVRQPLPAHQNNMNVRQALGTRMQGTIVIPQQQSGAHVIATGQPIYGPPTGPPPAHSKQPASVAMNISSMQAPRPLPAHQPVNYQQPQIQYIIPSSSAPIPQQVLLPVSISSTQPQQSFVVSSNPVIGQPVLASSGTMLVAVPGTVPMTTTTNVTFAPGTMQQRSKMIIPQNPSQLIRLNRPALPSQSRANVRPPRVTLVPRPGTVVQKPNLNPRMPHGTALVRAQLVAPTQTSSSPSGGTVATMVHMISKTRMAVPLTALKNIAPVTASLENISSSTAVMVSPGFKPMAVHNSNVPTTTTVQSVTMTVKPQAPTDVLSDAQPQNVSSCSFTAANSEELDSVATMTSFGLQLKSTMNKLGKNLDKKEEKVLHNVTESPVQKESVDQQLTFESREHSKVDNFEENDKSTHTGSVADALEESSVQTLSPKKEQSTEIPVDYDDSEFCWEEYLEETGSLAAPPTSFKHVEASLLNGFVKGMKLEVPNKCQTDTYWIASIIMSCGPLLRLRYDGYGEDSSADFWCDIQTSDIHQIGWCGLNNKSLQPPEAIRDRYNSWHDFLVKTLEGATTAPAYLLQKTGIYPIDHIKPGMRVIVQHEVQPLSVWVAKIMENIGGRLLLRWEGTDHATNDFWLFYLHFRIHPMSWPAKDHGRIFKPPDAIRSEHENSTDWSQILSNAQKESEQMPLVADIFKEQMTIKKHTFEKGQKVEICHPHVRTQLCPGTVIQVIDKYFFVVEIDDLRDKVHRSNIRVCSHAESPEIFPMEWSLHNGVRLAPPKGWPKSDFSWTEYLAFTNAESAPESCFPGRTPDHEFKRGMKLEAVNPYAPHQICATTITKIVDNLMWIHLDSSEKMGASIIVDVESFDVFPVGWCESNGYQLKPPKQAFRRKRVAVVQPEQHSDAVKDTFGDESKNWCPKIYFNHRCFSGPFLSKGRIAELPKSVGPGPVLLVMREVLSMLINVAYKSSRVLRELQLEGDANPNMHQTNLKAKYKGKSYKAPVEICRTTSQVEEFCRQVCIKLECCPYLISPHLVNGNCPENCHQLTKTKYTYYYGKKKSKRKIGRPPGGHSNLVEAPKLPGGKRRKVKIRPYWLHGKRKGRGVNKQNDISPPVNEAPLRDDSLHENAEFGAGDFARADAHVMRGTHADMMIDREARRKRKYTHHVPAPSDIQTRGAKLPKYSYDRKTHKKVLIERKDLEDSPKKRAIKHKLYFDQRDEKRHTRDLARVFYRSPERPILDSNPLHWSVSHVVKFIKSTDCASLARIFREQEIDGQAFLLLNLPSVQEHMELKLGPAIKLCHHIEKVKLAFFEQFAS